LETAFWQQVKQSLKDKNSGNKLIETWFDPVNLIASEETNRGRLFQLSVPSDLHKYWISENFLDRICSEISASFEGPFQVELIVREDQQPQNQQLPLADLREDVSYENNSDLTGFRNHQLSAQQLRRGELNPDYTFTTFVVGRNNEFAHAASHSVADNPGAAYNPLFICGPTGMGKTHLLNSVGNYIGQKFSNLRIKYVSAERFLNECIAGIRRGEMHRFRVRYRDNCDILLMDDIQVLGRGDAVQEEFFHTLNSFFETKRQVVVASDRMPKDINGLEDRIRTRLEWGLIADIQMPDMETRVAILRYKAEIKSIQISDDVVNHIARISKRSIRELEGNLNKVKMFAELQGLPITLELTKKILATHNSDAGHLSVEDIQKLVAAHFNIRINDLKSANRSKPIVIARQVAMFLIKKHLDKSLTDIGRYFGGKDHTTVINALRRIETQLEGNTDLKKDFDELDRRIHNMTGV
jgi:chromosomal replication initiator protein